MSKTLSWQRYAAAGLRLRVHAPDVVGMVRTVEVPEPVAAGVIGPGGVGATEDPARDLLRLEHHTRHTVARLAATAAALDHALAGGIGDVDGGGVERRRWWRRRRAGPTHSDPGGEREAATRTVLAGREQIRQLRRFIADLDVDGPLARARQGWARDTGPPAHAVVFDTAQAFLDADPRRATVSDWGGQVLAEDPAGTGWRHDPDDLLDVDPEQSGMWTVSYLPGTGEVYARRHAAHRSEEIWLLGTGLDDTVRWVLQGLTSRMADPNSLLLCADIISDCRRGAT